MYTSDTNKYGKIALIYLICSIFLALFGGIYEHFSFGVYSNFMLYSFAFPLVGGCLPALIFNLLPVSKGPKPITAWLQRCGLATLSVGSIIRGVLDIYGTENLLTTWYWLVGGGLCVLAGILYVISLIPRCGHSVSNS